MQFVRARGDGEQRHRMMTYREISEERAMVARPPTSLESDLTRADAGRAGDGGDGIWEQLAFQHFHRWMQRDSAMRRDGVAGKVVRIVDRAVESRRGLLEYIDQIGEGFGRDALAGDEAILGTIVLVDIGEAAIGCFADEDEVGKT